MWVARVMHGLYSQLCLGSICYCRAFVDNSTEDAFFQTMLNTQFDSFNSSETFQVLNGSGLPVYNIWQRQDATWVTVLRRYNPLVGPVPSDVHHEPIDIPSHDKIHEEAENCQRYCEKQVLNFQGQSCAEFYYINSTIQECMPCPENQIPSDDLDSCRASRSTSSSWSRPEK